MKKFFKIFTALTLVAVVMLSVTGCGKIKKMSDVYDFEKPTPSATVFNTVTKLSLGDYTDCESVLGRFIVLSRKVVTPASGENPEKTTYDFALYDWKEKSFSHQSIGLQIKSSPYQLIEVLNGESVAVKYPQKDGEEYKSCKGVARNIYPNVEYRRPSVKNKLYRFIGERYKKGK